MKPFKTLAFTALTIGLLNSCDVLQHAALTTLEAAASSGAQVPALTNQEVVNGLKEALTMGIQTATNSTSAAGGFLNNPAIRIPFPPEAQKVKDEALKLGLDAQVATFEETLNKAAEEAAKEAMPVFKEALLNMSVADGFAILKGEKNAATKYFQQQTTNDLTRLFLPKVEEATNKVALTKYWNPIISKYNLAMKFTGGEQLNPDLNAYVTQMAIQGLFIEIEKQELEIRKNPIARTTELLKRVFAAQD